MKRDGGIEILDAADKEAARNLFKQLGDYGCLLLNLANWNRGSNPWALQATGRGG